MIGVLVNGPSPTPGTAELRAPWVDRIIGDRTGDVLAWLAKRAKRRGDDHEFWHLYASLCVGNSNHDNERWPCLLPDVQHALTRVEPRR